MILLSTPNYNKSPLALLKPQNLVQYERKISVQVASLAVNKGT